MIKKPIYSFTDPEGEGGGVSGDQDKITKI